MLTKTQLEIDARNLPTFKGAEEKIDEKLTREWVEGGKVEVHFTAIFDGPIRTAIKKQYEDGGWKVEVKTYSDQRDGNSTIFTLS